jgi:hypothetical protein
MPRMKNQPLMAAAVFLCFMAAPRTGSASAPLDVIFVMDNSETMIQSDGNYYSVAAVSLLVDLLRPKDRLYLVSSGSSASVVMTGKGSEKSKFITSVGLMKRESSANDFVSAIAAVKSHVADLRKTAGNKAGERKVLVVWFLSPELRLNVKNPDYVKTEKAKAMLQKAKKAGFGKAPFKKKAVRDLHKEIFETAVSQALVDAGELRAMNVELNIFVLGKTLSGPGLTPQEVGPSMEEIVKRSRGRLAYLTGDSPGFILDHMISIFVDRISAPTTSADANPKGEQFEVYRKSKNLWVAVLFKGNPSKKMSMVSIDYTNDKVKRWPFGKRSEDVLYRKPEFEKGQIFKNRRWYKAPQSPVGYGLFWVKNPAEGIYRIKTGFEKGDEFLVRIFQDIDLNFGFLTEPAASIPMGKKFSAVAGLKGPDGSSFSFHRSFLNDLEFTVEMEKEGGGVPVWGESKETRFSKEGEVLMSFEPASTGIYYIRGEVVHKKGEFRAVLKPFHVEVYHRVTITFSDRPLSWEGPATDAYVRVDPGIRLAADVNIPDDLVFELTMDWSKVKNRELFDVSPGKVLKIVHGEKNYPLAILYKDPEALRYGGRTFEGPLTLKVKDSQKRNVEGSGTWTVNVQGRATPWTLSMYWTEYIILINILLILLVIVVLVIERVLRPSFGRNLSINVVKKFGMPSGTVATVNLGALGKPLLPFRRQRITIGTDGSVNNPRANSACRLVSHGKSFVIQPMAQPVRFRQGDIAFTAQTRFYGKTEERYSFGENESEIEFWVTKT